MDLSEAIKLPRVDSVTVRRCPNFALLGKSGSLGGMSVCSL